MNRLPIVAASSVLFLLACLCTGTSNSNPPVAQPTQQSQPQTGATVEFDVPTNTPEATATPVLGNTRNAPLPMDAQADVGGDMTLSIASVKRPANEIVLEGNMFNETPEPDSEYMIVTLFVECKKAPDNQCGFATGDIKVVGPDGVIHDQASVAGVPDKMEYFNEFFGGSTIAGNLVYYVMKDSPMVLFFDPLVFGDPVYIALQ